VSLDEATSMPPEQVVLVSTGSQGEPLSALGRMARGEHHQVTIEAGDTIVLASSLVPGNETAVYRVINQLARGGAIVVHKDVAKVHVSGHAPAGELLKMRACQPDVPTLSEPRHPIMPTVAYRMKRTFPQLEAHHIFPYNTRTDLEFSTIMRTLHDCIYAAASVVWDAASGCPGALRSALAPGYSCQGI
jgi:hypothetical protein